MMENFFLGIVEITLGMSLLIPLMLLVLRVIGGRFTAKCRYILWTLVMIRLAVPMSFGILPVLIEVPVEPEPAPVQIQVPVVNYTPVPQNPVNVQTQEQLQMPSPPAETPIFTEPTPEPLTWDEISAYIPHLYLTGAAVFLLWNLLSYGIYTGRIIRSAKPADPEAQRVYDTVCRKKELHRSPVLLMSPGITSPAAFGLLRRRIVLPDIDFTENGLVGTLSHEVTHCKRGDLWIKAVCLLARSFHWFNPLVHLAAFRCEMEMELSCDESVLAGCSEDARAVYGEVMLDIIKRCRRNRGALTTHFNPKKNAVKARFTNILYGSGKKRGLWLIAVCLVLCLIAGAIVACRTAEEQKEETRSESVTEPLPDGETVEIPLTYTPYTQEISQDMFVEEIPETELTEILQDQELCGVRVILYLDENELFCAAYEKGDTLFRFIRTGGVEPVSYVAEEFSDILEADGFTVSWSWSHRFRAYFVVEDGAPKLYLDAYDNVTEADYDNDGVTEVICQSMINVDIYDISDGVLQMVSFDSELIKPKPGEFYRYLPEKNWFEFDYKKDGEDTLFHRYGTVQDGILTLVTPNEMVAASENGEFLTIEAYVTDRMAQQTTAQYYSYDTDGKSISSQPKTANVTDTKLIILEKKGEVTDLAPEGVLECWRYKYLLKLDVPAEKVIPVGGQEVEDDWFDLEGQNGHTVVALRHPDGTYTILMDEMTGDGLDFNGYRNSYEEAIYDWYVMEYDLDLPLYVEEWGELIIPPEGEHISNTPVHRFDGDGWGIYIPVSTWYSFTDAMENQWLWRSSYNTGSTLMVDVFSHSLEDEYVTAEKQGYTPADSTNRVWKNHTDGLHSCYYYYENPNGGFWRVTIEWTDEGVTNDNANIAIEPQILKLMAEKFVVFGTNSDKKTESIDSSMSEPEVELVSYPYTDRVFPVPEYWEEEQIAVLEYISNTTPVFSFGLYKWIAHTENDTGLVWLLSAYTLEEFAEDAEFWKNTHDTDVYTQIFSQANYLLGTDTEYAYVLTLPTDVQFLEKDPISYQQYERLQISSQTVLGWFMEENGITPNPTCPASAVYAPVDETPEGIASAFLNRYLHQVYTYTETAFTELMDPAYHTPIAYLQDKTQYLSYTRQVRGEMAYDFDVEYYNTQTTNPVENFKACSIRASIRFRKEPYGEMVNLEERYIVTLRETETGWMVTDMVQENDRFDEMYKANGFDLNALLTEFNTSLAGNPDTIWQTFLDTVVAPYENYIASHEFLDLDGNGITELILYDLGMGVGEIFTIEGGEVRSLYTGDNILTHYSDERKALAPPSLGAGEYV